MKGIIDGKLYDTNTATLICSSGGRRDQVHEYPLDLYRSPGGQFFLFHDSDYGRAIELLDARDARSFFECHGDPDGYEGAFGQQPKAG